MSNQSVTVSRCGGEKKVTVPTGTSVFTQGKGVRGERFGPNNRPRQILQCVCGSLLSLGLGLGLSPPPPEALRDQRHVELRAVEQQWPAHWGGLVLGPVQQLEQTRPDVHRNPHDDALGHSCNHGGWGEGV